MKFPYGLCDFQAMISEGYYYADRTDQLTLLEDQTRHILFLRPRRFGKSLLLSMLENYYDLAKADQFAALFGKLKIGENPTLKHNQYFVLRWDFSMIKAHGTVKEVEQALHDHINACARSFISNYQKQLTQEISLQYDNGLVALQSITDAVRSLKGKLYLLIDEYDNFANEVMTAQKSDYAALVHGEGIVKTVFKAIKGLSAGQGIERVFITGVSPVVMSDISSGYNVATNITQRPEYSDLCGLHEHEIVPILEAIGKTCSLSPEKTAEALDMMRTFYNGYCFDEYKSEKIYNPTLALYFLDHLSRYCRYPRQILDNNLAMDRNRIKYISNLPHGQEIIARALDPENLPVIAELSDKFGVEDMLLADKDQPFMGSLLYYLGVLTTGKRDFMGRLSLQIPNLVIRRLYVERIQERLLPDYHDKETMRKAAESFYHQGELQALCEFVENRYFQVFDNRDYRWSNELVIKTAFLTLLFSDIFYIMDSETAIARRYTDLSMILRPDMRQYQLLDHLLEFKYIGLQDLGLSGAELQEKSRKELAQLPQVVKAMTEAKTQLQSYRATLEKTYGNKLRLHTHAVVALGFERLLWESEGKVTWPNPI